MKEVASPVGAVLGVATHYLLWMSLLHFLSYPLAGIAALAAAPIRPWGAAAAVGLVVAGIAWALFNKLAHGFATASAIEFAARSTPWLDRLCERATRLQSGETREGRLGRLQRDGMDLLQELGPISWLVRFALRQVGAGIVVTISDEIARFPDEGVPPAERMAVGIRNRLERERKTQLVWVIIFGGCATGLGIAGIAIAL